MSVEGPIEDLIAALPTEGEPVDFANPKVAHALTQALEKLGYCADTMALLKFRLGQGGDTYVQTRAQFDHGSGDDS